MEEILSDTSKFKKVEFNAKHTVNKEIRHLLSMEDGIKLFLKDLLENDYVSKEDYKYMLPAGGNPGVLYGLCKVHKDKEPGTTTPPFRPILSSIGTCTYKMAKFFVPLLKPHTINEYSVNDSFSLAEEVLEQDASLYMASFDVKSLFTNIPLNETIDICVDKMYDGKRKIKGMLKRHFKKLLSLTTKTSCFIFNGNYYSQVEGMAMGSPLGPTFANVFLGLHEMTWLDNCPLQFRPVYYRRYIDDVLVLFKDKTHVKKFLRYLNSKHNSIEFTHEEEDNNTISFLDIKTTRINNKFTASNFRKKTFSGVYLNFPSFLPSDYKKGLLFTLLYRAYRLSSSYMTFHEEIERLKLIWKKNNFPVYFIDKCILKFLNKLFTRTNVTKTLPEKEKILIRLPFLGKISLQLKARLRNIYKKCLPNIKLDIVFHSKNRIRNAFSFKDVISNDLQSLVLYKYKCSICNDACYVGKTKRHYKVRLYEHLGLSIPTDKSLKYTKKNATAVRQHIEDCQHASHMYDFSIIGSATNDYHLKIKESLVISKLKPSLNTQGDSIPLVLFDNY